MRVTVDDSGLCCCTCVTYFERQLTPLWVDSVFLPVPVQIYLEAVDNLVCLNEILLQTILQQRKLVTKPSILYIYIYFFFGGGGGDLLSLSSFPKRDQETQKCWIQIHKKFKSTLFIKTKHNMGIFGGNPKGYRSVGSKNIIGSKERY